MSILTQFKLSSLYTGKYKQKWLKFNDQEWLTGNKRKKNDKDEKDGKINKEIQIIIETAYLNKKIHHFNNIIKLKVGRVYTSNNFKSSYQYFVYLMSNQFGIEAIEIYFPKTFVDQA